jgi:DNA-binding PadR family transcriptional regulator
MTVRGVLLQLLAEDERHGYQLKVDFEARTGGIWALNVGQVYSTLERLVRDGAVVESGTGDAGQRAYAITEPGRHELKAWLTTSAVDTGPPRDELVMKVLVALGAPDDSGHTVIADQRAALLAALQNGRRAQRNRTGDDRAAERLAHDAWLSRIEADLLWLDRCEEMVRPTRPARRRA